MLEETNGAPLPSRRLSVLLFADVAQSTLLFGLDEKGMVARLDQARNLFTRLIEVYRGQVIDFAGDGVFAVFQGAVDAVTCAVALQREFREAEVWHAGGQPIRFRIGLHAGEVYFGTGGARGLEVNIANRVQEQAPAGGICVTELFRRLLPPDSGYTLRSIGTPPLKNVARPLELFELRFDSVDLEPAVAPMLPLMPARSLDDLSVAVLPFENLSGDPADRHLCEGVAADIIGNLSRFRELVVIARHSAFQFRPQNVPSEVGARLEARYLVLGSLQRVGRHVNLRLQLIEGASGRLIWSEPVKASLEELLDLEAEVAGTVAARLAVHIFAEERRRLELRHHPEPSVYGLVLRGHSMIYRYRREPVMHAQRLFEQAAANDPRYARVFAGLSRTYNLAWRYRWDEDPEGCLVKAVDLANRAIDYDDFDARGYQELGFAMLYQKHHDESLAAYRHASELNPNDADVVAEMADSLTYYGEPEQALEQIKRAMRLNPLSPDWYYWIMGDILFDLQRYDEVVQTLRRMQDQSQAHRLFAASLAHAGHLDQARRHAQELKRIDPAFSIEAWRKIPPYRDPAELDHFVEGLRMAGLD